MDKLYCSRFPVHARGEISTMFDEESDVQVENMHFRPPGPKIWENLIFKNDVLYPSCFKARVVQFTAIHNKNHYFEAAAEKCGAKSRGEVSVHCLPKALLWAPRAIASLDRNIQDNLMNQ